MHMRSTLNLDDKLIEEARRLTGIQEKTALIRAALEALIKDDGGLWIVTPSFVPDPEMNETYYLPEPAANAAEQ